MAPSRFALFGFIALLGSLSACKKTDAVQAPPAPAAAAPADGNAPTPTEAKPAEAKPADPVEAKPADPVEAKPAEPTPAPSGEMKPNEVTVTPGTIVRNPPEGSPEWLVQQVLVAAMDPDEAKGWERFVSLLSEDQKIEKALISRRELNFAASRRKVKLFLFEDPTKPIYKVDRVQQEEENIWRIFVHNNSPDSMPTPCQVRFDPALKKWGVGICSL
jgi:hypothetical protein